MIMWIAAMHRDILATFFKLIAFFKKKKKKDSVHDVNIIHLKVLPVMKWTS